MTSAQIDSFNRLVTDWNSRCSSYRYYESDLRAVQTELRQQRARLRTEGRNLAADVTAPSSLPGKTTAGAVSQSDRGARLLSPGTFVRDAIEIQQRLAALGLYLGAIDGVWGPGSRGALAEFKRRRGLPANADWDHATQAALFQITER